MTNLQPHEKEVARKIVISASISFALMIVDFLLLIRDEVKLVWPRLRTSWYARIYVFTRYVGLASQVFNVYFTVRMFIGVPTSPAGCRSWFAYQASVVQLFLIFAEGLFMHRLFALFLRSRTVLLILIMIGLCQFASIGVSARFSWPNSKYTTSCMITKSHPGNAFFSTTTVTTNSIIFFMTFWRFFRLPKKFTQGDLGKVVLRDAALSLSAITLLMIFMTLCSLQVIKPIMSGNITYYWLITILWISIGRAIVNHEKIPRNEDEQDSGDTWKGTVQLTSQIEIGQSELSLDTQCGSSDGQTPTSETLQNSLSTPVAKASPLSSSSGRPSDGKWFGDCSLSNGDGRRTRQPSSTEVSTCRLSSANISPSDGDGEQTKDHPQADERTHSPVGSPRPSSPKSPPSEVTS